MVDHVNMQLNKIFDTSLTSYHGLVTVPSKLLLCIARKEEAKISWKEQFKVFTTFYEDDLPNPISLDYELDIWDKYWMTYKGCHRNSVGENLKSMPHDMFHNIEVSLRILATLPVTSCECERSFSALRRLKNYNRSTMLSDQLNGLALMNIHQEIVPDINEVIRKFSLMGPRKLDFV